MKRTVGCALAGTLVFVTFLTWLQKQQAPNNQVTKNSTESRNREKAYAQAVKLRGELVPLYFSCGEYVKSAAEAEMHLLDLEKGEVKPFLSQRDRDEAIAIRQVDVKERKKLANRFLTDFATKAERFNALVEQWGFEDKKNLPSPNDEPLVLITDFPPHLKE
jgi:hypothetical protein